MEGSRNNYRGEWSGLWNRIARYISGMGYTRNIGTVTGILMNGVSKGTQGDIDLGNIQEKIDANHKLSADLIEDGQTNKVINVKPDWNAASGTDAEILNKPTIPAAQIQSDWNQSDSTAKDYIKNKPNIAAQVQSDWNQTDNTADDFIKNKPTVPTKTSELVNDSLQEELVSGTNIKTVNNQSILGAGNITIQGGGGLPYDAEIEYLGFSGTQYINLDYWTGTNLNIHTKISLNSVSNNEQDIVGNQCGANGTQRRFIFCVHNSKFCIVSRHSGGGDNLYFSSNYAANTKYNVFASMEPTNDSRAVSVDGIVARGTLSFCADNTWAKLRIGAGYASGGSQNPNYYFSGKIYNINIIGNNMLLYSLIPVRIGNVGYMYDKVSQTLFGNNGTGSFTLGPDVT